jgi:hypothetical protein
MTRNQPKTKFWTVVAVINIGMLSYPLTMLAGSNTQDDSIIGLVALCAVGLVLAIGDMISIMLAYSTSY